MIVVDSSQGEIGRWFLIIEFLGYECSMKLVEIRDEVSANC